VRRAVRIDKVKRPGGIFEFDMELVADDGDGIWLSYPKGAAWRAPHDTGTMPFHALVLVRPGDPFVTWWVDDPADRRIEVDICRPPTRTADGWSFVDLELDPVRHERTGVIEIEDDDEFEEACRHGWIDAQDAATASSAAQELAAMLARREEPWGDAGWRRLAALVAGED
jgi:hypothetical protein